jgi:hypothetical protein
LEQEMEIDPSRRVDGKSRNVIRILLIVLAVCGLLAILACGGIGFLVYRLLAPTSFPAHTEDYAEARKHFRTRLVKQGPAPQPGGLKHRLQGLRSSNISPAAFASRPG